MSVHGRFECIEKSCNYKNISSIHVLFQSPGQWKLVLQKIAHILSQNLHYFSCNVPNNDRVLRTRLPLWKNALLFDVKTLKNKNIHTSVFFTETIVFQMKHEHLIFFYFKQYVLYSRPLLCTSGI